MVNRILVIFLFILGLVSASAVTLLYTKTQSKESTTSGAAPATAEETKIQQVVKDYLSNNPQLIVEAFTKARDLEAQNETKKTEAAIGENRVELENSDKTPHAGNDKGDVVVVAFHDYNCGFCKRAVPDIAQLLKDDKNIKFVLKDFPILGELSYEKAKASEAVYKISPEKWFDFYEKLSEVSPQNVDGIVEVANKVGVNGALVKSEMNSEEILNKVKETLALGQKIGVRGTPAFIIGGKFVNGAIGLDHFKDLVNAARKDGTGRAK
jgi:protein-disulfide isomerase